MKVYVEATAPNLRELKMPGEYEEDIVRSQGKGKKNWESTPN